MARHLPPPPALRFLSPRRDEEVALRVVAMSPTRTRTRTTSRLPGRPDPAAGGAMVADFSNLLLRSAALCEGLRDLVDAYDTPRRL